MPLADVSASLIWVDILESDDEAKAEAAAMGIADPRMQHFFDPGQLAGRAVVDSLGGRGFRAWDVYVLYPRSARWQDGPPEPAAWVHQLSPSKWADPERYRSGQELIGELGRLMGSL